MDCTTSEVEANRVESLEKEGFGLEDVHGVLQPKKKRALPGILERQRLSGRLRSCSPQLHGCGGQKLVESKLGPSKQVLNLSRPEHDRRNMQE